MPVQVNFDHYELLTRDDGSPWELGRGAMGITYKAFDTNLRFPVALKVINAPDGSSESARMRFIQEARAAAKLRHRHVASVFHLGVEGDTYFYAMEYIDGETVEAVLKRCGPLSELIALRICTQVARALHAASSLGLVHRDIKPANLMLVQEDDELCAKVIDFGLAKMRREEDTQEAAASTTAGFVGTPHFASPEQLEEKILDSRSDIYSLGATLWFMLAGEAPFTGPVARVITQNLSAEPPFERLTRCSPAVLELLSRMLAKQPDARFQSPLELRQSMESIVAAAAGGPGAAAARVALEEASIICFRHRTGEGHANPGDSVAGHYKVLKALGETNAGWAYLAKDFTTDAHVRLLVLELDPKADHELFTGLEQDVLRLQRGRHEGLIHVEALESVDQQVTLSLEWTYGFTLLDLLRSRRKLGADEAFVLLQKSAASVEAALACGLTDLDLGLHRFHVHFPLSEADPQPHLNLPVLQWPRFNLKLDAVVLRRELSQTLTWAGGQTLLGTPSTPSTSSHADPARVHARGLAILIYELLGGAVTPLQAAKTSTQGTLRYSPLANLSEEGNECLRRALDPDRSFPTPRDFARDLGALLEVESRQDKVSPSTVRSANMRSPKESVLSPVEGDVAAKPSKPRRSYLVLCAAFFLLVAAAFVLRQWVVNSGKPSQLSSIPGTPAPSNVSEPSTNNGENQGVIERSKSLLVPESRDMLKVAITQAEAVENDGKSVPALESWIEVARNFPEAEIGRMRLELLIDILRTKNAHLTPEEILACESALKESAEIGVTSAMMWLGEIQREKSPEEAFQWFLAAAQKGVPEANAQVGLMYSNGAGVGRDLAKAVEYFQVAADQGDAPAKAALGECFLMGKGVEKDLAKGVELLQESAAKSNIRALNRLGTCYHQGVGIEKNYKEALRLFNKAAELGSSEALGNLGVLTMNGDGLPRSDPQQAVEYFKRGAEMGSGYCMYQYARCFENGTGVPASTTVAQQWYQKAAASGLSRAIEWCKQNGVGY